MAKLRNGILSCASGTVGSFVFSNWKGRQVARALPEREDHPTASQIAQRQKLAFISFLVSLIEPQVIAKFWKYYDLKNDPKMNFIRYQFLAGVNIFAPSEYIMSLGNLEPVYPYPKSFYSLSTGTFRLLWRKDIFRDGLGTDKVLAFVEYSVPLQPNVAVCDASIRDDGEYTGYLPKNLNPDYMGVFYVCYRGSGRNQEQSIAPYQLFVGL